MFDEIPFKVIHFLVYDIHYGGRVTDDIDRRLIRTILDGFINPQMLADGYAFSPSGTYVSLPVSNRQAYLDAIKAFPIVPHPEIFGMHSNADITCDQEEVYKMFRTVLDLLPRQVSGGGESSEEVIQRTAKIILEKVPSLFDLDYIAKRYPVQFNESMNTVLIQECTRYNRLLKVVRRELSDMLKAIRGEVVMSGDLEAVGNALFNNIVPDSWSKAYPSLMPLSAWVTDLTQRLAFINSWIERGTPVVFWISGFIFPQAFLTGTLQNYARKSLKPIDRISFGFRVVDQKEEELKSRPDDGCYVRGIFLEGARWDTAEQSLVDSKPKELFTLFPIVHFIPEFDHVPPATNIYRCPLYKTLTRQGTLSTTGHSTNFVLFLEVPSKREPQEKWIKAGVALFCALRWGLSLLLLLLFFCFCFIFFPLVCLCI